MYFCLKKMDQRLVSVMSFHTHFICISLAISWKDLITSILLIGWRRQLSMLPDVCFWYFFVYLFRVLSYTFLFISLGYGHCFFNHFISKLCLSAAMILKDVDDLFPEVAAVFGSLLSNLHSIKQGGYLYSMINRKGFDWSETDLNHRSNHQIVKPMTKKRKHGM